VKLRFFANPKVVKCVVTTDARAAITPGLLCREYLFSHSEPNTPIVFGDSSSEIVESCTISSIFPFPFIYRGVAREDIIAHGQEFAELRLQRQSTWTPDQVACYEHALAATGRDNVAIHPIKLAACVLYADGSFDLAYQLKGLEYGCTLCPVTQLLRGMLSKKPVYLCTCDQFGNAHAPFAQARALMSEHGLADYPEILVHNAVGDSSLTTAGSLAPSPGSGRLLVTEDLISSHHS